jgi:hypothetical protein
LLWRRAEAVCPAGFSQGGGSDEATLANPLSPCCLLDFLLFFFSVVRRDCFSHNRGQLTSSEGNRSFCHADDVSTIGGTHPAIPVQESGYALVSGNKGGERAKYASDFQSPCRPSGSCVGHPGIACCTSLQDPLRDHRRIRQSSEVAKGPTTDEQLRSFIRCLRQLSRSAELFGFAASVIQLTFVISTKCSGVVQCGPVVSIIC